MASKKTEERLSPAYFFERGNVMCKKELFLISTVLLLSLVGNTWAQGCDYIRVSQESSPGADT